MTCTFSASIIAVLLMVCSSPQVIYSRSAIWFNPNPFQPDQSCNAKNFEPLKIQLFNNGDWKNGQNIVLGRQECEAKEELGSILCPKINLGSRCSLFSPWGTRVTSCNDISQDDSVFAVPEQGLFMLPTKGVGYRAELYHLASPSGLPIIVETISEVPRIFKIYNLFSDEEANSLIHGARRPSGDHPSSPALQDAQLRNTKVTFDHASDISAMIRRRSSDLLGIFPMEDTLMSGMKIMHSTELKTNMDSQLRSTPMDKVNISEAFHLGPSFATLWFQLRPAEEGGGLVFPALDPAVIMTTEREFRYGQLHNSCEEQDVRVNRQSKSCLNPWDGESMWAYISLLGDLSAEQRHSATEYLEKLGKLDFYPVGHLERSLLSVCRSKFSMKSVGLEAVLVYSHQADLQSDYSAIWGDCPVMKGEQWTASVSIWNRAGRGGDQEDLDQKLLPVSASFESRDILFAKLYWEDQIWEELVPGKPLKVNTFAGHTWYVKLGNELLATWPIQPNLPSQRFVLSSADIPVQLFG